MAIVFNAPTPKEKILLDIRACRDRVSQIEDALLIFANEVKEVEADANLTKTECMQKLDYMVSQFGHKYGGLADDADTWVARIEESIGDYLGAGRYDDDQLVSALDAIRAHGDSLPESMIEQIVEDAKTQAGWARLVCKELRKSAVQSDFVLDLGDYVGMLDAVANVNLDTVRDMVWCAARSPLTHKDMHEPLNTLNRLEESVMQLHD